VFEAALQTCLNGGGLGNQTRASFGALFKDNFFLK
jgi:hypothetical protein